MKLLIVDDHPLFAEGIQFVLESLFSGSLCQLANSAEEALSLISTEEYDLLLIDLNMPGIDGLSLLQALGKRNLSTPIAVLSSVEDLKLIRQALDNGASGFIPKAFGKEELRLALRVILDGETFIPETIAWQLNRIRSDKITTSQFDDLGLSARQHEVLVLLSKGLTNKQMSMTLFVTEDTVKFHTRNLFRILHASNRTDCVLRARQRGLLPSD